MTRSVRLAICVVAAFLGFGMRFVRNGTGGTRRSVAGFHRLRRCCRRLRHPCTLTPVDPRTRRTNVLPWSSYLTNADFWARTLQNWQSEFLAGGSMVALAIYLPQRGSPESKPVGESQDATGIEGREGFAVPRWGCSWDPVNVE